MFTSIRVNKQFYFLGIQTSNATLDSRVQAQTLNPPTCSTVWSFRRQTPYTTASGGITMDVS